MPRSASSLTISEEGPVNETLSWLFGVMEYVGSNETVGRFSTTSVTMSYAELVGFIKSFARLGADPKA